MASSNFTGSEQGVRQIAPTTIRDIIGGYAYDPYAHLHHNEDDIEPDDKPRPPRVLPIAALVVGFALGLASISPMGLFL
jgi:hypothetical protein